LKRDPCGIGSLGSMTFSSRTEVSPKFSLARSRHHA
jgi:hypothetical protein